jgi:chromosome segregation ATPase
MEESTFCFECRHPITITEAEGMFLNPEDLAEFISSEDCLKADRVLTLASSPSASKHAMCEHCLKQLKASLEVQITETSKLKELYESCLEELNAQRLDQASTLPEPTAEELETAEAALHELKVQENIQEDEVEALQAELSALLDKERNFWVRANDIELKLISYEESTAEAKRRILNSETELDLLKSINVLNELFYIE